MRIKVQAQTVLLSGNTNFVLEYFENGGQSRVQFFVPIVQLVLEHYLGINTCVRITQIKPLLYQPFQVVLD
jgi:hypothetical protein